MTRALPPVPATADTDVLRTLALELSDLSRLGLKLQDLIAEEVRAGRFGPAAVVDAQGADLLTQRLNELAKFVEAYSGAILSQAEDPAGLAAGIVTLGHLAERLRHPDPSPDVQPPPCGDLEIF